MKKIYSFVMVSIIALTTNAQLVFNENFTGYTNGNLNTQGGWVPGNGTPDVQVNNASPLYYSGYTSGTQYIQVSNTDGKDPQKSFSLPIPTTSARFIFMSFVVRVSSASPSNNSEFSVALLGNSNYVARFYVEKNSANGNNTLAFGIGAGNETPSFTGFTYNVNETHLIVIRYDVIAGSNNDNVYLWVDPTPLSTEPTAGSALVSHLGSNGEINYGNSLDALKIFQSTTSNGNTATPVADFDAFRVAHGATSLDAWNNLSPTGASLPVILTSFNATDDGLSTKLVWNATEENGVANYVIEKSTDGRTFTAIGTVKATSQKTYSFTDGSSSDNNSYYRLKMVDIDGAFKYSYIVSIKSKLNTNISLSPNPVKNNLMIQHPKVITEGHIQVFSSNGQLLKDVRLAANAVISNVDMSGFTSGLYHIVFKSGSDMFNKTVIKQ
jgi:hypothetical protein